MRPETAAYLATVREDLREANMIAAPPLARLAARSAYYAAFYAAEALIFERTGKAVKTHSGVRSEFSRLLIRAAESDAALARILNKSYGYKNLADYGSGKHCTVADEDAADMIADASRFVERVAAILADA